MGTIDKTIVIAASIPHDYSADVYSQVQPILDNAPAGSIILFQENGLYRSEKKLQVKKPLDIAGNGATFKRTIDRPYGNAVKNTPLWRANRECGNWELFGTACTGARLRDFTTIGANEAAGLGDSAYVPDLEAQHAVTVMGAVDFEIDNLHFSKPFGDFIAILTGTGGRRPTDGYCHDFTGNGNGRQGISVSTGSDMRFEHYNLQNMRRAVYDVELDSDAALVERVTFGATGLDDVFIGAHKLNFLSCSDGTLGTVGAITVRGHQFLSAYPLTSVMQMELTGGDSSHKRGPYTIVDNAGPNAFGTPLGNLIRMRYVNGAEVHRNSHPLKTGGVWPDGNVMYGVKYYNSVNVNVSGNVFNGGREVFPIP